MNMMSCTSTVTHIFLLHASVVVHMEDSYSEFHSTTVCSHKLLQFLPTIASWAEFRAAIMILWQLEPKGGMDLDTSFRGFGLLFLLSCYS